MAIQHTQPGFALDPEQHETLPIPHDRLIGARVYHPRWGAGWLGFESRSDGTTVFWHITEDLSAHPLDFDNIHAFSDVRTSNLWIVFHREKDDTSSAFLLYPDESVGIRHVPIQLRSALGGDYG